MHETSNASKMVFCAPASIFKSHAVGRRTMELFMFVPLESADMKKGMNVVQVAHTYNAKDKEHNPNNNKAASSFSHHRLQTKYINSMLLPVYHSSFLSLGISFS